MPKALDRKDFLNVLKYYKTKLLYDAIHSEVWENFKNLEKIMFLFVKFEFFS